MPDYYFMGASSLNSSLNLVVSEGKDFHCFLSPLFMVRALFLLYETALGTAHSSIGFRLLAFVLWMAPKATGKNSICPMSGCLRKVLEMDKLSTFSSHQAPE